MRAAFHRMLSGQRRWQIETALRTLGAALVTLAGACGRLLVLLFAGPLPQQAGLREFLIAALAFGLFVAGLALLIEGPALFRQVPYPRRRLI